MTVEAYTIEQFCQAHGFSKAHYFNIAREGKGPRIMRVGSRVLISREAAADWRRACEQVEAVA